MSLPDTSIDLIPARDFGRLYFDSDASLAMRCNIEAGLGVYVTLHLA